jgi:DNA-binding response OmpR family regulator
MAGNDKSGMPETLSTPTNGLLKPPRTACFSEPAMQRPITVLLIEDNPEQADLVKQSLAGETDTGYRVEWVSSLLDGMKTLAEAGVDVVLLDLGLPELEGYKSHTAIRRTAPQVPIVILTADERALSRELTLSAGAVDYLIKGEISDAELRQAIRAAVLKPRNPGPASNFGWYT